MNSSKLETRLLGSVLLSLSVLCPPAFAQAQHASIASKEALAEARNMRPCESATTEFFAALDRDLSLLPDYALRLKRDPKAVVRI
jgi:hypothetical protein